MKFRDSKGADDEENAAAGFPDGALPGFRTTGTVDQAEQMGKEGVEESKPANADKK